MFIESEGLIGLWPNRGGKCNEKAEQDMERRTLHAVTVPEAPCGVYQAGIYIFANIASLLWPPTKTFPWMMVGTLNFAAAPKLSRDPA